MRIMALGTRLAFHRVVAMLSSPKIAGFFVAIVTKLFLGYFQVCPTDDAMGPVTGLTVFIGHRSVNVFGRFIHLGLIFVTIHTSFLYKASGNTAFTGKKAPAG